MLKEISDPVVERIIKGAETEVLAGPFRRDVRVALAKYYSNRTRHPEQSLACNVSDEVLEGFSSGGFYGGGGWSNFYSMVTDPSCNPLFAAFEARNYLDESVVAARENEQTKLDWG